MEIYVDDIIEDNGLIRAVAIDHKTVIKNLEVMLGEMKMRGLLTGIKNRANEPSYFVTQFHQFVVYFQYDPNPNLGMHIEFMDFQNDDDIALDRYLVFKEKNWDEVARLKVMESYHQIKQNNPARVNLVLTNPLSDV